MQGDALSIRIVVLAGDKEEEKAIAEAIKTFHADCAFVSSMALLRDALFERPCNGLLFCIAPIVGLDQNSKSFIQTLEQVFPVARIRWNKIKGSFALIASRSGRVETLSDYIAICSNFAPRRLRSSERISKNLNILISTVPDLVNPTHAFSIDISSRGCFLHTPHEWNIGDNIFIQIQEMPSKGIIEGKIVRSVPWGVPFCVQGVGVQFVNLEDSQIQELQQLLYYLPAAQNKKQ
jgi:Tfp pilus assembly protein PilZ